MQYSSKSLFLAAGLAAGLSTALPAHALSQGDWFGRVSVSHASLNVDSDPTPNVAGGAVDVENDTQLSFTIAYMVTDNWAVEVLGALPFEHDIKGAGTLTAAGTVATTKQLPPVISAQYHFQPKASIRPYVGVGVNYTIFFDVKEKGALVGDKLTLDNSLGLAGQVGVDMDINKDWFFNADVRYVDINVDANSATTGPFTVQVDPWVFTLGIGTRF